MTQRGAGRRAAGSGEAWECGELAHSANRMQQRAGRPAAEVGSGMCWKHMDIHGVWMQKAFDLHKDVSSAQEAPARPTEGPQCPDNGSHFQSPSGGSGVPPTPRNSCFTWNLQSRAQPRDCPFQGSLKRVKKC